MYAGREYMAYRKLSNIRESILEKVTELGAKEGISSITARKVASLADISTHTIYTNFLSMDDLINEAALRYEKKELNVLISCLKENISKEEAFLKTLQSLMEEKNGTLFYSDYRSSKLREYYDRQKAKTQKYIEYSKMLFGDYKSVSDKIYLFLWNHAIMCLFVYSSALIKGKINDTLEARKTIIEIIFNGTTHILPNKKR